MIVAQNEQKKYGGNRNLVLKHSEDEDTRLVKASLKMKWPYVNIQLHRPQTLAGPAAATVMQLPRRD